MDRRQFLRAAGMGAAAVAASSRGVAAASPVPSIGRGPDQLADDGDWPEAAQGVFAQRRGRSGIKGLTTRWTVHLTGGIPGAPAITDGHVYAASYGGLVAAVDLATGTVDWQRTLPVVSTGGRQQGFFAGPAVTEDLVVVASDRAWALDVRSGVTVWTTPPIAGIGDGYFWGPPCIVGTTVLIGSGSGSESAPGIGRVSCYNLDDGRLLWSTPTVPPGGNGGGVIGPVTADVSRGVAYALTGAPYAAVGGPNPGTCSLIELRLTDGAIIWQDQVHPGEHLGRDFNSAPMVLGSSIFGTAKDGLYAWDRTDRRRLWHTQTTPFEASPGAGAGPTSGPEGGPLATDGTRVFFGSNDAAANSVVIAAVEPDSGSVLWRRTLPGFEFGALAVAGDGLWVALASGDLYGLRTGDGSIIGHAALGDPSAGAVTAAHGSVLVGTGTSPFLPGDSLVCIGG